MKPATIIDHEAPEELMVRVLERLHTDGPVRPEDLETLAYLKFFHCDMFAKYESKLTYLLGLFHKVGEPQDVLSLAYSTFRDAIKEQASQVLTPVQASIRNGILEHKYFTFSTPTSAGKSYLFRSLIKNESHDVVIVVPSRALIAEYLIAVRELVHDDQSILVLQFIDDINKATTSRRVFIVTPERGKELFSTPEKYDVSLFLFDEAQLSEEEWRGVSFDAFVRRADRTYPDAKKVFAHPFIENPEAQLTKHGFNRDAAAKAYFQGAVGKIYLGWDDKAEGFTCFSPFIDGAHLKRNRCEFSEDVVAKILERGGSLLAFVSKASIYDKSCIEKFRKYVDMCEPVTDQQALGIIEHIEQLIGASGKKSDLVRLMRRGIVLHHGSVPLPVRFQIELFTKSGFARICFSTSTLAQGVNMPFDVVWADNLRFEGSEENKAIGIRNLIGRAGRTSLEIDQFDYGFVIVENMSVFTKRMQKSLGLAASSLIDNDAPGIPDDLREEIDAIRNNTLSDEYNLPTTRVERLSLPQCHNYIATSLDLLFVDGKLIKGGAYRELPEDHRISIKNALKGIFSLSLKRDLELGEQTVLSTAITILLWHVQGKAFREVITLRHGFLTRQGEQLRLKRKLTNGEISEGDYLREIKALEVLYSAVPYQLPNSKLKKRLPSSFPQVHVSELNFDRLVYDTYDYLDKVISFSLADIFVAAYGEYYKRTRDVRAQAMVNYVRYGTNDETEIWLLRYGFSFEDIELLTGRIRAIDENGIVFDPSIEGLQDESVMELINRYR